MKLKAITLLSEDEYTRYKSIIPNVYRCYWWLKTLYPNKHNNRVRAVDHHGDLRTHIVTANFTCVRPFCVFDIEPTSPIFWYKHETLIGTKIQYGKYTWTILDTESGRIRALCDEMIAKHRFDEEANVWEKSELKSWLETEGLSLITK